MSNVSFPAAAFTAAVQVLPDAALWQFAEDAEISKIWGAIAVPLEVTTTASEEACVGTYFGER
jgi:hypothetical protein